MKKLFISAFSLFCLGVNLQAQHDHRNCGSTEHKAMEEAKYPEVAKRRAQLESEIRKRNQWKSGNRENGTVVIIPTVFHVIYSDNNSNISEAQIQSQIDILNADFRKTNSNVGDILAEFQARAADTEIQFCLATVDPNGQPTSGITRKSTSISDWDLNDNMKQSSQGGVDAWDRDKYLNIWVVPGLKDGVLGFAQFPGGQAWSDGVVIADEFIGNTGSAGSNSPFNQGRTATHEVGHWLGLYHIWGDSNCGDDQVSDTPTQQESSSGCPLTSNTCDGNTDNVQNYMDYSNDACMAMFTQGQAERMWNVLNTSRSGLKSAANTKCANDNPPIAGFTASKTKICAGEEITFTDGSIGLPSSWQWTFENGTPSSSTLQNPKVVFNTGGSHKISLVATNDNGPSDAEEKDNYIEVTEVTPPTSSDKVTCDGNVTLSATTSLSGSQVEWYSDAALTNQVHVGTDYTTTVGQTTTFYAVTNTGGSPQFVGNPAQGTGGFHAGNQGVYFDALQDFKLISAKVYAQNAGSFTMEYTNPSGVSITKQFNVQAGENTVNLDLDIVAGNDHQISMPNTGDVQLHRDNSGVSYPYSLGTLGEITKSTAQGVELDYYYYYYSWEIQKKGCKSVVTPVEARLDVCVGLEELKASFSVYPNPSNGSFQIENINNHAGVIQIFDIRGKMIKQQALVEGLNRVSNMNLGTYLLTVQTEAGTVQHTVIVK